MIADQGRIWGCYVHGMFANQAMCHAWLASLGWQEVGQSYQSIEGQEAAFERLADAVEAALPMAYSRSLILNLGTPKRSHSPKAT